MRGEKPSRKFLAPLPGTPVYKIGELHANVAVRIVLSLLVGYPKWKVRCSVAANFPR